MPPTSLMVSSHTLATEIVTRDKNEVFEDKYLDALEAFVTDPSRKDAMLSEMDMVDDADARPGSKANSKGSLVGLCIARHGTNEYVFRERDIEMLREWFKGGKKVMTIEAKL
jgi:hypothetical protein